MDRGPRGTSGVASWLPRAGRLIADNQRLLVFEGALRVIEALAFLAVTIAARNALTFDGYARDAVDSQRRTIDLVAGRPSTATIAALVAAFLIATFASAWLRGSLIRSLQDGGMILWPGGRTFARLAVIYATSQLAFLGASALSRDDGTAPLVLPAVLLLSVPTLYADYAAVLDGLGIFRAFAASVATVRRHLRGTLFLLAVIITLAAIEVGLLIDPVNDSSGVFPPFFAAILLTDAALQYVEDCALIAVYRSEARLPQA